MNRQEEIYVLEKTDGGFQHAECGGDGTKAPKGGLLKPEKGERTEKKIRRTLENERGNEEGFGGSKGERGNKGKEFFFFGF